MCMSCLHFTHSHSTVTRLAHAGGHALHPHLRPTSAERMVMVGIRNPAGGPGHMGAYQHGDMTYDLTDVGRKYDAREHAVHAHAHTIVPAKLHSHTSSMPPPHMPCQLHACARGPSRLIEAEYEDLMQCFPHHLVELRSHLAALRNHEAPANIFGVTPFTSKSVTFNYTAAVHVDAKDACIGFIVWYHKVCNHM